MGEGMNRGRRRIGAGTVIAALLLAAAAGVGGWFTVGYFSAPEKPPVRIPLIELKGYPEKGDRNAPAEVDGNLATVRIFSPRDSGLSAEIRRIKPDSLQIKMAENLIAEYLRMLPGRMPDSKVLGVYRDKKHVLYVDLSDDFRRSFSGDARQEFLLLKSLYETVVQNVPGAEDVRILVEGKETESIGGHFIILSTLREIVKEE
jgi:hypothetical protein